MRRDLRSQGPRSLKPASAGSASGGLSRVQLALELARQALPEDLGDLAGGHAPESDLRGALEDLVDGKMALEDEVAAVLGLVDGIEAAQVHRRAFAFGKLRSQHESPVVEPLADDFCSEAIGGRLQRQRIGDSQKRIVVLAEAHLLPVQFLLDKIAAMEIVGGLEGEKRGHPHGHRSQHFIFGVEAVMGEAAALPGQDATTRSDNRESPPGRNSDIQTKAGCQTAWRTPPSVVPPAISSTQQDHRPGDR